MDEDDLIKTGMEVVLRPITAIAEDALGRIGGDWLHEKRRLNRERLRDKTDAELRRMKIGKPEEPSPSIAIPLLGAAQDESREELLNLWASLMAASMDPARAANFRRKFIDVVNQLEPTDVAVLPLLANPSEMKPSRSHFVATKLRLSDDQVFLSLHNLARLDLTEGAPINNRGTPVLSPLGRQLLALVS